ncbi:hypothetical protein ACKS0A_05204 [Histoplasma ohiense]
MTFQSYPEKRILRDILYTTEAHWHEKKKKKKKKKNSRSILWSLKQNSARTKPATAHNSLYRCRILADISSLSPSSHIRSVGPLSLRNPESQKGRQGSLEIIPIHRLPSLPGGGRLDELLEPSQHGFYALLQTFQVSSSMGYRHTAVSRVR